ncbi:hypothetical protein QBC43DRAFT_329409 [Cladorrhinum sp. PSN259]|nr:hypothetical protein QBC43DRAFT_329409 [Cladorrhinum sp. PSN259]
MCSGICAEFVIEIKYRPGGFNRFVNDIRAGVTYPGFWVASESPSCHQRSTGTWGNTKTASHHHGGESVFRDPINEECTIFAYPKEKLYRNVKSSVLRNSTPAPYCDMATFPQFSLFPFELRYQIWVDSIPDAEPQVVLDPFFNFERYAPWPRPPLPIGFPAMMHTCHEARTVALEQFKKRYWPTLVRADGLSVPRRYFMPELDILFLEHLGRWRRILNNYKRFVRNKTTQLGEPPEQKRLTSIGVPWGGVLSYEAIASMPSLQTIYVVVCDVWPLPAVPDIPPPPWDRRFKLEAITEDEKKNGIPLSLIYPDKRNEATINDSGLVDIQVHAQTELANLIRGLEYHKDDELVKEWWANRPEKGMGLKVEVVRLVRAEPWYRP